MAKSPSNSASAGTPGCVCRNCCPPFRFYDKSNPTPLDLLILMEESGLQFLTDGVCLFLGSPSGPMSAAVSRVPPTFFHLLKQHRVWFLANLVRVPTELLREMFGEDALAAARELNNRVT
jgi:hypothetical protein